MTQRNWSFGRKQAGNPIPAQFAFWVRVYSAVMVAFMAWMPTAHFISHNFQDIATSIIGLTVTIANIILPFFGVEVEEGEKVPAKDVTVIETENKP